MQTPPDSTASFSDIGASPAEAWATLDRLLQQTVAALPRLAVAIILTLVFWGIALGVRALIRRTTSGGKKANVGIVLSRLTYYGLLVFGIFVAAAAVIPSFTFGSLVSALGIGGVAIGFAFKDIFQNLLAGILLLLREPFRVGDEITSGSFTGTVEAIETRATFIKTYDGRRIIVPNSIIYTESVTVISAYDMLRSQYDVGIGYGDDIDAAKQILLQVAKDTEGILDIPAPDVLVWDLAGASVNLRLRWWSHPKRSDVVVIRDKVLQAAKERILAAGIDLPFPTQQILFHDQTETTDGDRATQREGWPARKAGNPEQRQIAAAIADHAAAAPPATAPPAAAPPAAAPPAGRAAADA